LHLKILTCLNHFSRNFLQFSENFHYLQSFSSYINVFKSFQFFHYSWLFLNSWSFSNFFAFFKFLHYFQFSFVILEIFFSMLWNMHAFALVYYNHEVQTSSTNWWQNHDLKFQALKNINYKRIQLTESESSIQS